MVIVNNHKHSEQSEQMVGPGDVSHVAAQILTVARTLGINAEAVGASIGPTFTEFEFTILDVLFNDGILASFEEMLSNELQRGSAIKCTRIDKKLAIVIPHIKRLYPNFKQYLTNNKTNNKDRIPLPIGMDIDGKIFYSSLDKTSNILICGSSGSGKSMFINQILCSLIFNYKPEELGLVLIDPKAVELDSFKDLKHLVFPFASSVDKTDDALTWVISVISNRKTNEQVKHEPILVIIDEFADCAARNKMFHTQIEFIAENGPAFNIYIIMSSQKPRYFIDDDHKAHDDLSYKTLNKLFKTKVIFHMSYDSKKLINEDAGKYLLGSGDMFFSCENKCLRLQGFYVDDDTIKYYSEKNASQNKYPSVVLGLGKDGKEITHTFGPREAVTLMAGTCGNGRSVLINRMLTQLITKYSSDGIQFILADTIGISFNNYKGLPCLIKDPLTKPEEIREAMDWILAENERRVAIIKESDDKKKAIENFPAIIFVIDEYSYLFKRGVFETKDMFLFLLKFVKLSRYTNTHIILSTQRREKEFITTLDLSYMDTRMIFHCLDEVESERLISSPDAVNLKQGEFLYMKRGMNEPVFCSFENFTDKDVKELIKPNNQINLGEDETQIM